MTQQMGIWGGWFSGSNPTATGEKLLKAYFFEAQKFPEFTHPSFEAYVTFLKSRVPDIVETIGELVESNYRSTTVEQAETRMRILANQSGGKATIPQLVQTAGGSGDTINWWAAIPEVAQDTAIQAGSELLESAQEFKEGAGDVWEGGVGTLKVMKYLPWILGGVAVLAIGGYFIAAGSQTGRGVRALAEAGADRIRRSK